MDDATGSGKTASGRALPVHPEPGPSRAVAMYVSVGEAVDRLARLKVAYHRLTDESQLNRTANDLSAVLGALRSHNVTLEHLSTLDAYGSLLEVHERLWKLWRGLDKLSELEEAELDQWIALVRQLPGIEHRRLLHIQQMDRYFNSDIRSPGPVKE